MIYSIFCSLLDREDTCEKINLLPQLAQGEFLLGRRGTWFSSGHSFNLRSRRTMSDNGRNLFFWLSRLPAEAEEDRGQGVWGRRRFNLSRSPSPSDPSDSHSRRFHIPEGESDGLEGESNPSRSPFPLNLVQGDS